MSDIFISYSREDRDFAQKIAARLEEVGWSVWWDRKIPAGRTFSEVIEEQITAAKCVIVIWSEHSIRSDWVQNEAAEGHRRHILAPVMRQDVEIPFEFRRLQAANLSAWDGSLTYPEFQDYIESIRRITPVPIVEKEDDKRLQTAKDKSQTGEIDTGKQEEGEKARQGNEEKRGLGDEERGGSGGKETEREDEQQTGEEQEEGGMKVRMITRKVKWLTFIWGFLGGIVLSQLLFSIFMNGEFGTASMTIIGLPWGVVIGILLLNHKIHANIIRPVLIGTVIVFIFIVILIRILGGHSEESFFIATMFLPLGALLGLAFFYIRKRIRK